MKAYKKLVLKALELGYVVSVFDGEAFAVKRSRIACDIFEAVESVEEAELVFRSEDPAREHGMRVGWALVIPDLDDDETVADHFTYVESVPHSIKYKWIDDCLNEGEAS